MSKVKSQARTAPAWIMCLLAAVAVAAGCKEGPMGPPGPQGPAGPAGPVGPAGSNNVVVLNFSGQVSVFGSATVTLPAAAGTLEKPPVILCAISSTATGRFELMDSDASCSFRTGNGSLIAVIAGAPANWHYRIVVVYQKS